MLAEGRAPMPGQDGGVGAAGQVLRIASGNSLAFREKGSPAEVLRAPKINFGMSHLDVYYLSGYGFIGVYIVPRFSLGLWEVFYGALVRDR